MKPSFAVFDPSFFVSEHFYVVLFVLVLLCNVWAAYFRSTVAQFVFFNVWFFMVLLMALFFV